MKIEVTLKKDQELNMFSVQLPWLGVHTQAIDFDEAIEMITDGVKIMHENLDFDITPDRKNNKIYFVSSDKNLFGIILKESRLSAGLSLNEAASRLGLKNHNSIYVYENGSKQPTMKRFFELLDLYKVGYTLVPAA